MIYKIYIIFFIIYLEYIVFEIEFNVVYVNMVLLRIYVYFCLNGWILKVIIEINKVNIGICFIKVK